MSIALLFDFSSTFLSGSTNVGRALGLTVGGGISVALCFDFASSVCGSIKVGKTLGLRALEGCIAGGRCLDLETGFVAGPDFGFCGGADRSSSTSSGI